MEDRKAPGYLRHHLRGNLQFYETQDPSVFPAGFPSNKLDVLHHCQKSTLSIQPIFEHSYPARLIVRFVRISYPSSTVPTLARREPCRDLCLLRDYANIR